MTRRAILLMLIWILSSLVGCGGAETPSVRTLYERRSPLSEGISDQARNATFKLLEPLVARHQRLGRECLRLASAPDLDGFTERFAQLERVAQRLKSLGAKLEGILGEAELGEWRAQQKLRAQVEMERQSLIAGAPLILDVRGAEPTALREAVIEVFREDLIALGALAQPSFGGDDPCEAQVPGALLVRMRGDFKRSSLGDVKVYNLPYHVTVESCAARQPLVRFKLGLHFIIPDNSTLGQSARKRLRQTAGKTRAQLYNALHLILPLKLPSVDSI